MYGIKGCASHHLENLSSAKNFPDVLYILSQIIAHYIIRECEETHVVETEWKDGTDWQ